MQNPLDRGGVSGLVRVSPWFVVLFAKVKSSALSVVHRTRSPGRRRSSVEYNVGETAKTPGDALRTVVTRWCRGRRGYLGRCGRRGRRSRRVRDRRRRAATSRGRSRRTGRGRATTLPTRG